MLQNLAMKINIFSLEKHERLDIFFCAGQDILDFSDLYDIWIING